MNVCVSVQNRFEKAPDGTIWTNANFPYNFWKRYLEVFDGVKVLARIRPVSSIPSGWNRSDGEMVTFGELPYYLGPYEYLSRIFRVKQVLKREIGFKSAIIFRAPSPFSEMCRRLFHNSGRPFGIEILGDPIDLFSPGTYKTPILPLIRVISFFQLKIQCKQACAAAYVTQKALQSRYPCPRFEIGVSDVSIPDDDFAATPRVFSNQKRFFSLLFVGSLQHMQKGPDILLKAVKKCLESGLSFHLTIVGTGEQRAAIERLNKELCLEDQVRFVGHFPAFSDLKKFYNEADLYILPSRADGLPKTLIEAMAAGTPCIASTVGGIPELLNSKELFQPGDFWGLAQKIKEVLKDPLRLEAMSLRNLEFSKRFQKKYLDSKFKEFLLKVKKDTDSFFL